MVAICPTSTANAVSTPSNDRCADKGRRKARGRWRCITTPLWHETHASARLARVQQFWHDRSRCTREAKSHVEPGEAGRLLCFRSRESQLCCGYPKRSHLVQSQVSANSPRLASRNLP